MESSSKGSGHTIHNLTGVISCLYPMPLSQQSFLVKEIITLCEAEWLARKATALKISSGLANFFAP